MRIDSTANERIKGVRRLQRRRERRRTGRTLVEGPNLITVALEAGIVPTEVYTVDGGALVARCEAAGSRAVEVSPAVLEVISTTVEPQDPVGVIVIPEQRDLVSTRTVVAVEISDPGNVGTLIRSAGALGWQIALIGGADPWSPKVLRASAGVQLSHPAISVQGLDTLIDIGLTPIATAISGGVAPGALEASRPIALLVGNEVRGLDVSVVDRCAASVTIQMPGHVESLNAAVAGAIAMYALGLDSGKQS
jgi:TrmH family RNA methyltransferase